MNENYYPIYAHDTDDSRNQGRLYTPCSKWKVGEEIMPQLGECAILP